MHDAHVVTDQQLPLLVFAFVCLVANSGPPTPGSIPPSCYRLLNHLMSFRCYNKCLPAGVLACLDGYMNIALEQSEEYLNGQLKNKYGDAFIRGNNVLYISTQKRRG